MKVLIIRFSSIGDLTQALSIPGFIHLYHPDAEIHFVTRQDLASLVESHPHVKKLWSLDRKTGLTGLFHLTQQMNKENYTHIYDAHNNLRSFLIRLLVRAPFKLVRPMMRFKRFLLLNFHINRFEKPFSGQRDLLKPLEKWNMKFLLPDPPQLFFPTQNIEAIKNLSPFVVLVPSAAYALKRWPIEYWNQLIQKNPEKKFVVLAGAKDNFTEVLDKNPNVLNLTGKTNLLESAAVIKQSQAVVTNDTGLLHFAEQLGKPTIALMGPAPFGFPSRPSTLILERDLKCRPCSKHGQGPCTNTHFQECLRSISADEVSRELDKKTASTP
ncbi:MAG: glycosyltransferase family 9 protein [Pseudobdellovibrio sp.]